MARPWEYPRWRRVTMQAAMWVILAGTLGLAQLVTHHRQNLPVELDEPESLGPVMVRPPQGWEPAGSSEGTELVFQDPQQDRWLQFSVSRAGAESDADSTDRENAAIPFAGLHVQGVMRPVRENVRMPDGSAIRVDALLATAVLPSGYEVTIELATRGMRIGPADRKLVQAVANGITPASKAATTRPHIRIQVPRDQSDDDP